jgi:hypothetical protein
MYAHPFSKGVLRTTQAFHPRHQKQQKLRPFCVIRQVKMNTLPCEANWRARSIATRQGRGNSFPLNLFASSPPDFPTVIFIGPLFKADYQGTVHITLNSPYRQTSSRESHSCILLSWTSKTTSTDIHFHELSFRRFLRLRCHLDSDIM